MKNIKRCSLKQLTCALSVMMSMSCFANDLEQNLNYSTKNTNITSKLKEKFRFSYYLKYLGPSLSDTYQSGATYHRSSTGQDWKGDALDATNSTQLYHSLTFGYQASRNVKISYGYTFQDKLNKDINYRSKNLDGSYSTYKRTKGVSDNNKRLNAFVTNLHSSNFGFLIANFFYEFPSTKTSLGNEMNYGIGFQPTYIIYTNTPGLFTGISASFQRNYYKNQQFDTMCGEVKCKYPTRYRTAKVSLSPYMNYMINDKITVKSKLDFDWDKQGDQVKNLHEFNKNMDDIATIGLQYNFDRSMYIGTYIDMGLENFNMGKTALGANFYIAL